MAHTKEEIVKMISLDEPDYESIAGKLGQDDVPILVQLSKDPNPGIATKAVSCLGLMKTEAALAGVQLASKSDNPVIRVAAAHALRNMSNLAKTADVLGTLLDDPDIGVRKFALKSVDFAKIKSLKNKVKTLNTNETNPTIKTLSGEVLNKIQ